MATTYLTPWGTPQAAIGVYDVFAAAAAPTLPGCASATGSILQQLDQTASSSAYSSFTFDVAVGQSFDSTGMASIDGFCLSMSRTGSPTGTIKLQVKAHSGTYGTSSVPTGAVLAESLDYDIAAVSTNASTFERYWLELTSALVPSVQYYTVEVDTSSIVGDASNSISFWANSADAGADPGNLFYDSGAGYVASSSQDLLMRIYGTSGDDFEGRFRDATYRRRLSWSIG